MTSSLTLAALSLLSRASPRPITTAPVCIISLVYHSAAKSNDSVKYLKFFDAMKKADLNFDKLVAQASPLPLSTVPFRVSEPLRL